MATVTQANQAVATKGSALARGLGGGIIGGLAGGVVFGLMMQMMDSMPMVAMLVGSESIAVAWVVHLAISVFIGAVFGILVAGRGWSIGVLAAAGAAYGIVWWVLGPLLLMPAKLGMPLFQVNTMVWQSLMGHVVFGVVLGLVAGVWLRRAQRS
jgi:uncharacterized membrane protein YagU involved in acid resistance